MCVSVLLICKANILRSKREKEKQKRQKERQTDSFILHCVDTV